MAVMMGDLYNALRSAGADDEKARKAASEVVGFENRLASLGSGVSVLIWVVGFNLALTLAIAGKLFVGSQ